MFPCPYPCKFTGDNQLACWSCDTGSQWRLPREGPAGGHTHTGPPGIPVSGWHVRWGSRSAEPRRGSLRAPRAGGLIRGEKTVPFRAPSVSEEMSAGTGRGPPRREQAGQGGGGLQPAPARHALPRGAAAGDAPHIRRRGTRTGRVPARRRAAFRTWVCPLRGRQGGFHFVVISFTSLICPNKMCYFIIRRGN